MPHGPCQRDTSATSYIRSQVANTTPFDRFVIDRGQGRELVRVEEVLSDAILITTTGASELVHVAQLRCFAAADRDTD